MAEHRIVIGDGPDALLAAAVLATGGHAVTLLQGAPTATGLRFPDLPSGTGRLCVTPEASALVAQVLGPLAPTTRTSRAVQMKGSRFSLPLSPLDLARLIPAAELPRAARAWTRQRGRNALHQIIGSGTEERCYRDWVVRRMGEPAFDLLYRSYAERRWGLPATELSVSVARQHHGAPDDPAPRRPSAGQAAALAHAEALLRAAGGVLRCGVAVDHLRVVDGRVVAINLGDEEIPVTGPLWVARSPATLGAWLGEAVEQGFQVDAAALAVGRTLAVALRGDTSQLPSELHVLDEGAPFYRVLVPEGAEGLAVFQATLAPEAEAPPDALVVDRFLASAIALKIGPFEADGARVERLVEDTPLWSRVCLSRLRRLLLRYRALGIVAVGRAGMFTDLDFAQQIAVAGHYRDEESPDQREIHRALVDPPVLVDDLNAHIGRFIER